MTDNKNTNDADKKQPSQPTEKASSDAASSRAATSSSSQEKNKAQSKNTASSQPKSAAKPAEVKKEKGSKLGGIAIVLVILLGAGLYYHGHQQTVAQNEKINALSNQVSSLSSSLSASETQSAQAIEEAVSKTQVLLSQQDETIKGLQMALSEVKGRRPNDWLLAEADYLVKMAGRKLWLERDALSATVLMESADQRIAQLNDPSLMPVRKALADDITALKAIKRIDRDGLVLRLATLQNQVEKLPLANAIMPEAEVAEEETVSESVDDWQQNLKTSLSDFMGNFVTYRKRDGNVVPLLSPEQTFYLQENLKAKLDLAMRSVYRGQGRLYAESLATSKDWAQRFFNMESSETQNFINQLDQLSKQAIEVTYPESLRSQSMISDLIDERLRRDIAPLNSQQEDNA